MAYNPTGEGYSINIIDPITDLHFENQTRYGFVGNIVIPCDNNIGPWEGTITRTDVTNLAFSKAIDAGNFNADNTVFKVDGLVPGSYQVSLQNESDNTKQLQSGIIDITKGWVSRDFEYRSPIQISAELYKWDSAADTTGIKLDTLPCSSNYELQTGMEYLVMIEVVEQYGANSCPVENATVSIGGDMGVLGSGFSGTTDASGQIGLVFAANKPNFLGDNTRTLQITATHNNRNTVATLTAYNTGSVQENNNFSITDPNVSMVLHDPPGDGSSITVNESFSYVHRYDYAAGTQMSLDFGFGSGADTEVFAGVGVISKVSEFSQKIGLGTSSSFTYKTTGGNSVEYSLNQNVSTSSSDIITGLDADVYIGLGTVISFGTGKTLSVDNCTPQVDVNVEVAKFEDQTPFVYTHQDVKDVLLVQLELLKQDAANNGAQNGVDNYQHQISKWNTILDENETKRNSIATLSGFDSEEEKISEMKVIPIEF